MAISCSRASSPTYSRAAARARRLRETARSATGPSGQSMTTLARIQRLLVEKFELKPDQLQPESQLDGLGLDSLAIIEFMFNVEDEFKIKMPDERVEIKTVQDIVTVVDNLVAMQAGKTA
jgi:acyl carrier protein